jgi:hypothetical protein
MTMKSRKLRRCNNCGHTAHVLNNSCKKHNPRTGKTEFCGTMRVVRDGV